MVKRNKIFYLVGALLLALAVTGGIFAATATSDTVSPTVTVASDLASVAKEPTNVPTWKVFPRFKGAITPGKLFTITPQNSFNGDLLATLYITNGDDLARVYNALIMEIQIFRDDTSANVTDIHKYLTLESGSLSLAFDNAAASYSVNVTSGYYSNFVWAATPTTAQAEPVIFCEVTQAGPQS
jgi:hypothetical protein